MSDLKSRVRHAVEQYTRNQSPTQQSKKKNEKPEKGVEHACVQWMRLNKWDVNVFEAKATYDPRRGIYRQQAMQAGTADCMGNLPTGHAVIVEFKAPGKLSSFAQERNAKQHEFMMRKISTGAFACVVDSVERLQTIYQEWKRYLQGNDLPGARKYLLDMLPKKTRTTKPKVPTW